MELASASRSVPERPPRAAHLGLEAGKAGGTVAQAEDVLVEHDGPRVVLPGEAAGGVEVVGGRARRRRELELGDREADHVQGDGGTGGGEVGVAQHRRPLGRGRQRDAQDAADVHAERLEVVRGQHLVGVGLVRQATAHQLDHLGQLRRGDLVDGEVVDVDGVTGARRGADGGREEPRHRRDLRQGRDPGDRAGAVEEGVVAVGRLEAGERRGGPAGGGRPGQHEADHHRGEQRQGQPRAPAMPCAGPEHQSEKRHGTSRAPV